MLDNLKSNILVPALEEARRKEIYLTVREKQGRKSEIPMYTYVQDVEIVEINPASTLIQLLSCRGKLTC